MRIIRFPCQSDDEEERHRVGGGMDDEEDDDDVELEEEEIERRRMMLRQRALQNRFEIRIEVVWIIGFLDGAFIDTVNFFLKKGYYNIYLHH